MEGERKVEIIFEILYLYYSKIIMAQEKNIGRFIVSDPNICHGRLTFKDTRIFVDDVLSMVAEGYSWNYIQEQWHGSISKDAIKEALTMSKDSLIHQAEILIGT